jgi:hypothetical protein
LYCNNFLLRYGGAVFNEDAAMNQTIALSPSFERARKLSRIMAVIFTVGFWLMLALLVLTPVMVAVPNANGSLNLGDSVISFAKLSGWHRLVAGLGVVAHPTIPALFLTHHARRLFGHFAHGEVFTAEAIAHIRAAGIWLILYTFTGIAGGILIVVSGVTHVIHNGAGYWPLLTGITTVIAAYVMAEASRIAADHAEIV